MTVPLRSSSLRTAQRPTPPHKPAFSRTVVLRIVAVVGLLAGVGLTYGQVLASDFPMDMIIYQEGVHAFLEGHELYSVLMQAGDVELPFIYPPFGALILVPLAAGSWMTYQLAGAIMIIASSALILVSLWFVLRAVLEDRVDRVSLLALTVVAWAVALSLEPVRLNADYGQINVLLMGLVVLDLVPRKRRLPQGWLIGIAAAIKVTPLAMLLIFLLRRDFRAILTAAVSALAATGIAALVRWDATVEFFNSILVTMGTQSEFGVDVAYQSNSSLKAMVMRWFPSAESLEAYSLQINIVWITLSLATIVLGSWFMVALMRRNMLVDAVMVNALIMLLISPVSWSHHWVWLSLILPVVALRCIITLGKPVFLSLWILVWTVLLLLTPPKWWFEDEIDPHGLSFVSRVLINDYVWLAVILLIAWAVALRQAPVLQNSSLAQRIDSGTEPPQ